MKNDILVSFLSLKNLFKNNYLEQDIFDNKYFFDMDVTDCLMKMYFVMLSDDSCYEKRLKEFIDIYNKLNKEQQEYVYNEYLDIINTQNKEKVLRKE